MSALLILASRKFRLPPTTLWKVNGFRPISSVIEHGAVETALVVDETVVGDPGFTFPWWLARWLGMGVIAGATVYGVYRGVSYLLRNDIYVRSAVLSWSRTVANRGLEQRLASQLHESTSYRSDNSRPHPDSDTTRTNATRSIENSINRSGMIPYSVSGSRRENGGQRLYYLDKDLRLEFQNSPVTDDHVLMMIDVDYYADMAKWLSLHRPIVAYTFVPQSVAASDAEMSYTIRNDEVHFVPNGGETWVHKVWDWDSPSVLTKFPLFDAFCQFWRDWSLRKLWYRSWYYVYSNVKSWSMGPSRRIVLITPSVLIPWYMRPFLPESVPLSRRKYTFGEINAMRVVTEKGVQVNVGLPGHFWSVTIPEDLWYNIEARKIVSKTYKTPADVERLLQSECKDRWEMNGTTSISAAAMLLFQVGCAQGLGLVHRAPRLGMETSKDMYNRVDPAHYQCLGELVMEDGDSYARSYGPQVISLPPAIPARSVNNTKQCIEGRVNSVRNTRVPQTRFSVYANDFVQAVVPKPHIGIPLSFADVNDAQDGPGQRMRAACVQFWMTWYTRIRVMAFQKKETYGKITSPRNISTVPTEHTMSLSGFSLSFKKDCLSEFEWFSPGKTPRHMGYQLQRACIRARDTRKQICCGDYSKFDGTISRWLIEHIEQPAYLRWVTQEHYPALERMLKCELNSKAVAQPDVRYDPGSSRRSGSPLTSDSNTLINAFVAYAAMRENGSNHTQAFLQLNNCLFYGDDSVVVGAEPEILSRTADFLGLGLKVETIKPGAPVPYLGRVFVDPTTTLVSMQDPKRSLQKIHVTMSARGIPLPNAAVNRLQGYLSLEPNCPIISKYCELLLARYRGKQTDYAANALEGATLDGDRPYYADAEDGWETFPPGRQYRCDERAYEFMATILSQQTGRTFNAGDLIAFERRLGECCLAVGCPGCMFPALEPLECGEIPVEVAAVVDGEILRPQPPLLRSEVLIQSQSVVDSENVVRKHESVIGSRGRGGVRPGTRGGVRTISRSPGPSTSGGVERRIQLGTAPLIGGSDGRDAANTAAVDTRSNQTRGRVVRGTGRAHNNARFRGRGRRVAA